MGLHREAQSLFRRQRIQNRPGQAAGLRAEQQGIAGLEPGLIVTGLTARSQGEHALRPDRFPPLFEAVILLHPGQLVIVEPGAARPGAVQLEAERMDQVQRRPGVGRQTNNIARVRRDFRFIKDDVKHE